MALRPESSKPIMGHETAAIIVVGNEILSGRTREANAHHAAKRLFSRGCLLHEIAIVPDELQRIVATIHRLRPEVDAIITSGGIGPTHDDITMEAVAVACKTKLIEHPTIIRRMKELYGKDGLNPGRRKMARLPKGARLIECSATPAPGCAIENIYVFAGVPEIFAAQLEGVISEFGGTPFFRRELHVEIPESLFSQDLEGIQQRFPDLQIGSYPSRCGASAKGTICITGKKRARIDQAYREIEASLAQVAARHA